MTETQDDNVNNVDTFTENCAASFSEYNVERTRIFQKVTESLEDPPQRDDTLEDENEDIDLELDNIPDAEPEEIDREATYYCTDEGVAEEYPDGFDESALDKLLGF